jgi:hypothetical protein
MESQKAEIEPPVYFQEGELISVSKKRKGSESSLN